MSDTILFGRKFTGQAKTIAIYTLLSFIVTAGVSVGTQMLQMEHAKWESMWAMQKAGWWILLICGSLSAGLITLKAATSNSTRKES